MKSIFLFNSTFKIIICNILYMQFDNLLYDKRGYALKISKLFLVYKYHFHRSDFIYFDLCLISYILDRIITFYI